MSPTKSIEDKVANNETRLDRLERLVERFVIDTQRFKDEMRDFKDEMKTFKDEMRDFKDEMKDSTDEMNRKWGDLANKMGTVVEDIVGPGLPGAIENSFNLIVTKNMLRVRVKKNDKVYEIDVIAVADNRVFAVEVKSKLRTYDITNFEDKLRLFFDFFPDYKDKKLVGVISSLHIDKDLIDLATKRGLLALSMSGYYMTFLNADDLRKRI